MNELKQLRAIEALARELVEAPADVEVRSAIALALDALGPEEESLTTAEHNALHAAVSSMLDRPGLDANVRRSLQSAGLKVGVLVSP